MFSLTSQERRVILFLAAVSLFGCGMKFLTQRNLAVSKAIALNKGLAKINLNKASERTLIVIPAIGQKLARRIIEYRQAQGRFEDLEELKKIKGIGNSNYEKIEKYLSLE